MTTTEFINGAPVERQAVLTAIHETIIANDQTVIPVIKPMMGKEMILYEQRGYMKYALASAKQHMSLHCLPMYMKPELLPQFEKLLPDARFQKGCINFNDEKAIPADALRKIIAQCACIDIAEILENRKKK